MDGKILLLFGGYEGLGTSCKVLSEISEPLIAGFTGKPIVCDGVHALVIVPRV